MFSKNLLLGMLMGLSSFAFAQNSEYIWAKTFGIDDLNEAVTGSGMDANGNVFISGNYYNGTLFDGQQLEQGTADSSGMFIAKMGPDGTLGWIKSYRSERPITNTVLVTHKNGVSFLAGRFVGELIMGAFVLNSGANDPNGGSLFLARFLSNGEVDWAFAFEANDAKPTDIELDASNNIILTGSYTGTVDFDGTQLSNSARSCFVVKFNSAIGSTSWAKQLRSNTFAEGTSIATASDGAIYVGGLFEDSLEFNAQTKMVSVSHNVSDPENAFISKLESNGTVVWAKKIEGLIVYDRVMLAFCNQYLYAAVGTYIAFKYDTETLAAGHYVLRINSSTGAKVWMKEASLPFDGLTADGDSAIYLTNPGTVNYSFDTYSTTTGEDGIALIKLDNLGALKWIKVNGGDAVYSGMELKALNKKVLVGGEIGGFGDVDFGPGITIPAGEFFTSNGFYAMFNDSAIVFNPTPTALTPINTALNFTVYPNPASAVVHIDCSALGGANQLYLTDMSGKVLREQELSDKTESLDLRGLEKGVYLVRVSNEQGTYSQKLLLH